MSRRQLLWELLVNGLVPYLVYQAAKRWWHLGDAQALLWATVIPGLVVLMGLVRQRRLDWVASITLVTLLVSIAMAMATKDARLLQLRESYLSAALGVVMLLSAVIGRPLLVWLLPRVTPPERAELFRQPVVTALMSKLTWLWGGIFAGELAIKWWMVESLTIAQVLAVGPVVFAVVTLGGCAATLAMARALRRQHEAIGRAAFPAREPDQT